MTVGNLLLSLLGKSHQSLSCSIQSSYAALQRINQDLEDKIQRTVGAPVHTKRDRTLLRKPDRLLRPETGFPDV